MVAFFLGCGPEPVSESSKPTLDFPLQEYTIQQIQEGYREGEFTIREVTQHYLDRIAAVDDNGPQLNAVLQTNPDALQIADELDQLLAEGKEKGPLHGIPILLKDNIDTFDKMATTAGSRALAGSQPLQDSWVAQKLRAAGAVILGKANLSEWANFRGNMSTSGWSGLGGLTRNPYVLDRNPCGSSSGSGVAVSANLCVLAIGTETNGSIVCPSTANGIVGIKPTVGLWSRSGIVPISFTQDTPGPMARSVRDAAICLGTVVGNDPRDEKTAASQGQAYEDYTQFLRGEDLQGRRIGVYRRPIGEHFKVGELFENAVDQLKKMGATVVEIDQIGASGLGRYSFQVLLYEFKDGLNKYFSSLGEDAPIKSVEELVAFNETDSIELKYFGQQLLERAQEKGDLDSPEYLKALETMQNGMREEGIDRIMNTNNLDAIVAPTGGPAWKTDLINGDAFHIGSSSPAAIAGYPNISVPMGFIEELPVGLSFFGRAWSEPVLLEIAYAYEQNTKWRKAPKFIER